MAEDIHECCFCMTGIGAVDHVVKLNFDHIYHPDCWMLQFMEKPGNSCSMFQWAAIIDKVAELRS